MPPIRQNRRNRVGTSRTLNSTVDKLNDDCLLEIFKYLHPLDMCSVKDSCRRFRILANIHMASVYKSEEFILENDTIIGRPNNDQMKIFFKFCEIFKKLSISVSHNNWLQTNESFILSKIRKFNLNLSSLTLASNNFDIARSRLCKTFPNLKKITLECLDRFECDIRREEVIASILKSCRNAVEISFGSKYSSLGGQYQGIFLQQKFKNLRSLVLFEVRNLDLNNLNLFLRYNPDLKNITLKRCFRLAEFENINFIKNAPNINGISLHFGASDDAMSYCLLSEVDVLCKLEKLKYLSLDTGSKRIVHIMKKLAERNCLKYLALTNFLDKVNEGLSETLRNMTNLHTLRVTTYSSDTLSIDCPNLIELHLRGSLSFEKLCYIVENSISLKILFLPSMGDIYNELNHLELVEARLRKAGIYQLTIYIRRAEYSLAIALIPNDILIENSHIIRLAEYNHLHFDDCWIPNSI